MANNENKGPEDPRPTSYLGHRRLHDNSHVDDDDDEMRKIPEEPAI